MRAVVIDRYGGPEVLTVRDLADPEPGPGQVVVRMAASGLNRLDVFVRQGLTGPGVRQPRALPHVMGAEGAGTVVDVGPVARTDLVPGDHVMVFCGLSCGHCRYCRRGETSRCPAYAILGEDAWGVQRELVALDPASLLRVPPGMSSIEAAAVPTTFTTAWTMLMTTGRLRLGERVLVVGASGGVATAAMQLAARAGAEVWAATRSPDKARRLSELPYVHHVVDSSAPGWSAQVRERTAGQGVDLVADAVGAPTWRDSIRALAMGGRLVICGATGGDRPDISIRELYQAHRQILGAPFGGWNDFVDVVGLMERTGIRPLVHATVPMERTGDGHRIIERDEHIGKVVIDLT
ncbi:zinc-binding dehydrogenase [Jiangella mangrovi]|uniref:NADPH:quinone reductase-like Zn-dependent oxidoreductase n=1 Tax=Jiangella mangrovi TaxID=1524084 RepID=A0A7W9GNC9_9ACTN|nr:zinc-binding dehydrogenase [Jiangella mangrovi]MBB5787025.1 NADPH:quinone reductase-like Zn-dependent oxidoreductase [Jiangella mangrovi]